VVVVDVEEGLQVRKPVGGAQLLDRVGAEPDGISTGEREGKLGLEHSFEMHVQLGLREPRTKSSMR
jgi:hypothetical protein